MVIWFHIKLAEFSFTIGKTPIKIKLMFLHKPSMHYDPVDNSYLLRIVGSIYLY